MNIFKGENKEQSTTTLYKVHVLQGAHVNDAPNNEEEVITNTNELRSSSNKRKRKWRSQWTLLHPWAYVTKSLLGEDKIKCIWCEDARKNNVFTDGGSQSLQLSSLNEHSKSFDHVIASAMYYAKYKIEMQM